MKILIPRRENPGSRPTKEELLLQVAFSDLLNRLLSRFVSSSASEIDKIIQLSLGDVGEFFKAEHVYLILMHPEADFWSVPYEWSVTGQYNLTQKYQHVPLGRFPWSENRLLNNEPILVASFKTLPPEALAEMNDEKEEGVRSMLQVPLRGKGGLINGCINLRIYTKEFKWLQEDIQRLRVVSDVLGNVIERRYSERALKDREMLLNTIINGSPIPQFVIDKDHRIIYWNRALEEYTGIKMQEIVGSDQQWRAFYKDKRPCMADLLVDENIEEIGKWYPDKYSKSKLIKEAYEGIDFFPHLGQDGKWLYFTAAPIRDDQGGIIGAVETLEDITGLKLAEEEIRQAWERLNTILDASPVAMFITRIEDGRILYANQSACLYFDLELRDMLGGSASSLYYDPEDRRKVIEAIKRDGILRDFEFCCRKSDGSKMWAVLSCQAIQYGKEIVIISSVLDITARKMMEDALRDTESRLKGIIHIAPVGIGMVADRVLLQVNEKVCQMTGYSQEELIGKNARILYQNQEDFEFVGREKYGQIRASGSGTVETRWKRKDGLLIDVVLSSTALNKENHSAGVIFTALDITEHKKAEEKLRQYGSDLEAKVKERTLELEKINSVLRATAEKLQRAIKAKSEFLANMSHELRTPLNSINGFSEVLYDETFGALNDKQKRYVGNILASGRHLLSLINDVLDLAKVEAGKMELSLSVFSLKGLIEEAEVLIKELALKKGIETVLELNDGLGDIEADERKIKEVFYNLLSNAIKFTPEGGRVGVKAKRNDTEFDLEVWDTGIGLAPENLDRVFEAFTRIESAYARVTEGTGLGLAFSKKLIELHKGNIWIESGGINRGLAVKFTLPIKQTLAR